MHKTLLEAVGSDRVCNHPAQEGVPAGIPAAGHHVVACKDVGDGRTEMTVTEHGYTSDQTHDLSKLGLEQCLDKMASIFAK